MCLPPLSLPPPPHTPSHRIGPHPKPLTPPQAPRQTASDPSHLVGIPHLSHKAPFPSPWDPGHPTIYPPSSLSPDDAMLPSPPRSLSGSSLFTTNYYNEVDVEALSDSIDTDGVAKVLWRGQRMVVSGRYHQRVGGMDALDTSDQVQMCDPAVVAAFASALVASNLTDVW